VTCKHECEVNHAPPATREALAKHVHELREAVREVLELDWLVAQAANQMNVGDVIVLSVRLRAAVDCLREVYKKGI
jgi:predicted dinucleotide-binding enzyme